MKVFLRMLTLYKKFIACILGDRLSRHIFITEIKYALRNNSISLVVNDEAFKEAYWAYSDQNKVCLFWEFYINMSQLESSACCIVDKGNSQEFGSLMFYGLQNKIFVKFMWQKCWHYLLDPCLFWLALSEVNIEPLDKVGRNWLLQLRGMFLCR